MLCPHFSWMDLGRLATRSRWTSLRQDQSTDPDMWGYVIWLCLIYFPMFTSHAALSTRNSRTRLGFLLLLNNLKPLQNSLFGLTCLQLYENGIEKLWLPVRVRLSEPPKMKRRGRCGRRFAGKVDMSMWTHWKKQWNNMLFKCKKHLKV